MTPEAAQAFRFDPSVLRGRLSSRAELALAYAQLTDAQKRALLRYGDQDLARALLGNDPFVGAISADPVTGLSTLARIRRAHQRSVGDLNEGLNKRNLFYSGYRGKALADLARERAEQEFDAAMSIQEELADLMNAYLGLARQARQERVSRALDAYTSNIGALYG